MQACTASLDLDGSQSQRAFAVGSIRLSTTSPWSDMASRAAAPLEHEDTIRQSCAALAGELLNGLTQESK